MTTKPTTVVSPQKTTIGSHFTNRKNIDNKRFASCNNCSACMSQNLITKCYHLGYKCPNIKKDVQQFFKHKYRIFTKKR